MRDEKGFDLWSDEYDESVRESRHTYPFDGYPDVLGTVYRMVPVKQHKRILDVGVGTGVLTRRFYQDGAEVCGIDFSEKMLERAREAMPGAVLVKWDFSRGLPPEFEGKRFDAIVSTYALHHLHDEGKVALIVELQRALAPDGALLIGDVAFETVQAREKCRRANADAWDRDEFYLTADILLPCLEEKGVSAQYRQISSCAGILKIGNGRKGGGGTG